MFYTGSEHAGPVDTRIEGIFKRKDQKHSVILEGLIEEIILMVDSACHRSPQSSIVSTQFPLRARINFTMCKYLNWPKRRTGNPINSFL